MGAPSLVAGCLLPGGDLVGINSENRKPATLIRKASEPGGTDWSCRAEPEAAEPVLLDLGGQVELPLQVGAHRPLGAVGAVVPVVVPEDEVDALGIGRAVGRRGDRQPGVAPGRDAAGDEGK